jgi:hypothetical protein
MVMGLLSFGLAMAAALVLYLVPVGYHLSLERVCRLVPLPAARPAAPPPEVEPLPAPEAVG